MAPMSVVQSVEEGPRCITTDGYPSLKRFENLRRYGQAFTLAVSLPKDG